MSESHAPTRTPTGVDPALSQNPPSVGAPQDGEPGGVQDRVRETTHQATQSLGDIAHEARDQASEVAGAATRQVRSLADQARGELDAQAESQQRRAAEGLRSLSAELSSMARSSEDPGYATDLVQQASDATDRVASWLDERDPGSLVREVQDFARRRPGLFIALAAGAGLLVGRLARGMKDAPSSGPASSGERERAAAAPAVGPTHGAPSGASTGVPGASGTLGSPGTTGTTGSVGVPGSTGTAATSDTSGAHSAGWSSSSSLLDRESLGAESGTTPVTPASAEGARHGETDDDRV